MGVVSGGKDGELVSSNKTLFKCDSQRYFWPRI